MTAVLAVIIGLALVAYFVAALVSILRAPHDPSMKLVWAAFALIAPFVGSTLWFTVGRRRARPSPEPRPAAA